VNARVNLGSSRATRPAINRLVRGAVTRLVFWGVLALAIIASDQFPSSFYLNL